MQKGPQAEQAGDSDAEPDAGDGDGDESEEAEQGDGFDEGALRATLRGSLRAQSNARRALEVAEARPRRAPSLGSRSKQSGERQRVARAGALRGVVLTATVQGPSLWCRACTQASSAGASRRSTVSGLRGRRP
jgi:hypothetical protein